VGPLKRTNGLGNRLKTARGHPTRVVPPGPGRRPEKARLHGAHLRLHTAPSPPPPPPPPFLFRISTQPALPPTPTPDFSTPDNKGGGRAASAVTQRRARPRPAPPLPSGEAGPAPRVWRGRAGGQSVSQSGSGRAAAGLLPSLLPPAGRLGVSLPTFPPCAAGRGEPPRRDTVNKDTEPKDPYPIPRKIMAEPDYIDDDNPELIRPQKLINPVKSSRNHQDLHRELLMNQKRGLAPQNKPELQKVMEKRKRDQVIKQQKEEEAQKKKSDLEIELLKRQQKLEQLELEQQKMQEEQENAPEFVKVKGNLRRTVQEATEAPDS
uniref:Family with sequence similarity 107 member B n=2 Tax=Telluraves TaxID=3073808 RepID=A0A8B9MWU3_9AVES